MATRLPRLAALVLVASLSLGFAACGGGGDGADGKDPAPGAIGNADDGKAPAAEVALKPTTFEPADVTIKAGESVRWTWGGGVQHDVTGDGFKSKLQAKGQFDHTFDTAGTYEYKCEVHPTTMKGTITVQ
jgi:plastocyanin